MKKLVVRHGRTLLVIGSAALIGVGVAFFVRQDLGAADQYASVASFFVGTLGLVISALSLIRGRSERTDPAPGGHTSNVIINNATAVQTGDHSTMHVNRTVPLRRRSSP